MGGTPKGRFVYTAMHDSPPLQPLDDIASFGVGSGAAGQPRIKSGSFCPAFFPQWDSGASPPVKPL